jgi:hypothetical protein
MGHDLKKQDLLMALIYGATNRLYVRFLSVDRENDGSEKDVYFMRERDMYIYKY